MNLNAENDFLSALSLVDVTFLLYSVQLTNYKGDTRHERYSKDLYFGICISKPVSHVFVCIRWVFH